MEFFVLKKKDIYKIFRAFYWMKQLKVSIYV
jgi:hypothetical protein